MRVRALVGSSAAEAPASQLNRRLTARRAKRAGSQGGKAAYYRCIPYTTGHTQSAGKLTKQNEHGDRFLEAGWSVSCPPPLCTRGTAADEASERVHAGALAARPPPAGVGAGGTVIDVQGARQADGRLAAAAARWSVQALGEAQRRSCRNSGCLNGRGVGSLRWRKARDAQLPREQSLPPPAALSPQAAQPPHLPSAKPEHSARSTAGAASEPRYWSLLMTTCGASGMSSTRGSRHGGLTTSPARVYSLCTPAQLAPGGQPSGTCNRQRRGRVAKRGQETAHRGQKDDEAAAAALGVSLRRHLCLRAPREGCLGAARWPRNGAANGNCPCC